MKQFIGANSLEGIKALIDQLPMNAVALKPAMPVAAKIETHEYGGFTIREWQHSCFDTGKITTRYDTAYEIPEVKR